MGFSCGIIGLPNVGKSTIFSALTSAKAAAANFPFCTIEPNTGAVPVPDGRLEVLCKLANSERIIPTQVTFVDIAGLIRGASKGEGLGNQFLGHIRSVDAVAHVVRCFNDDNIIHVEGNVDPVRDVATIELELLLADLDAVQRQLQRAEKNAKSGDKDGKLFFEVAKELEAHLSSGKAARLFVSKQDGAEAPTRELLSTLITAKPTLFVANVSESDAGRLPGTDSDHPLDQLAKHAKENAVDIVVICGKVESEIAELAAEERRDYLSALGLNESGLDRLAIAGSKLLQLITFFTVGPKETHAWTALAGSRAPHCAGKIHTDFERGFIRAEVISFTDYVTLGSEAKCRDAGRLRVEGKEYVMQDGDIVHFRFNT